MVPDNTVVGMEKAHCAHFTGNVLVVECENDDIVPHPVITNYRSAFEAAHSLTYRLLEGADHGLTEDRWQRAYTSVLVNWAAEMIVDARKARVGPSFCTRLQSAGKDPTRGTGR